MVVWLRLRNTVETCVLLACSCRPEAFGLAKRGCCPRAPCVGAALPSFMYLRAHTRAKPSAFAVGSKARAASKMRMKKPAKVCPLKNDQPSEGRQDGAKNPRESHRDYVHYNTR